MTNSEAVAGRTRCWCGHADLVEFCATYARCPACGTLVSRGGLTRDEAEVRDDGCDFYGKTYWLARQRDELGLPDIYARAHLDLPERCLHWLRTLLTFVLPPARVLELGSGHGAFVAIMRWAGFDASGLEISPWVVDFARQTFGVPVLLGTVEEQDLPEQSLDAIVLNDLLEHLVDPLESMRRCAALLRPNGVVLVQTPCYPAAKTYQELLEERHPFLAMLQEREHLYLFSQRGVRRLFEEVGLGTVHFEPALFSYDMYFVASREEPAPTKAGRRDEALFRLPSSRMVKAMLDLDDRVRDLSGQVRDVEDDRQARIRMIEHLTRYLAQVSADHEARLKVILEQQATIERLTQHIEGLSADYEARLRVILHQQMTIERLTQELERVSPDYEARLKVILDQQTTIERLQHESLRASEELAARQRLGDEQQSAVALLREQVARLCASSEAQVRMVTQQHANVEGLIQEERRRADELEARLQLVEDRQRPVDALANSRVVRVLRALGLVPR